MGCWYHHNMKNLVTKNLVCDGTCDVIDDWIDKTFGRFNVTEDAKRGREIFNKITGDKKAFMSLYNKVRKKFIRIESPETKIIDRENSELLYELRSGKITKSQYDKLMIEVDKKENYRDMTVREFVCHLEFCTGSYENNIKIPSFVMALDKQQQQEVKEKEKYALTYKQEHPSTLADYMMSPKKGGGLFTISVGVNKSSLPKPRKVKKRTTRKPKQINTRHRTKKR